MSGGFSGFDKNNYKPILPSTKILSSHASSCASSPTLHGRSTKPKLSIVSLHSAPSRTSGDHSNHKPRRTFGSSTSSTKALPGTHGNKAKWSFGAPVGVPWSSSSCVDSEQERIGTEPIQRVRPQAFVEKRRRYVVGTMPHCGSIYEELARQLVETGRWTHVSVRQRAVTKQLYVMESQCDLTNTNMHVLLGEKMPCERVIAARRNMGKRFKPLAGQTSNKEGIQKGNIPTLRLASFGIRMPMGNGEDGEPRLVDFVENTRCITLKSTMVATLLKYHHYDWNSLGSYLPMSFKLLPRQPLKDERQQLLDSHRCTSKGSRIAEPPLWIVKSSSGCHGDNIEIFEGDRQGLMKLLRFIDSQSESQPWIAQQYIDRPLLYHKRKFDLRFWVLLLRNNYEIFVHEELVMRTSSIIYTRESATSKCENGRLAHITNHCVQASGEAYSLYEEGNELWREHLDGLIRYKGSLKAERMPDKVKRDRHLHGWSQHPTEVSLSSEASHLASTSSGKLKDSLYPIRESRSGNDASAPHSTGTTDLSPEITLNNTIIPQVHFIVRDTLLAARPHIPTEPLVPPTGTFQVLGYDFLIDENMKVWLLEINGAPGAAEKLTPILMRDTIEYAIAPHFPGTIPPKPKRRNGYVRVYGES